MTWTCPICGRIGKRSQEHIFGRWLAELLGVTAANLRVFSSRDGPLWSTVGLGVVVNVCATCNNGWMSRLEGAFKARFSRAILGHLDTFDGPDLTTLAHWGAKTSLLLQIQLAGMGEATHIPVGHARQLPEATPPHTRVWIGTYAPMTRPVFWQGVPMSPAGVPLGPAAPRIGYLTLLTIGRLLLVILSLEDTVDEEFQTEGLPLAAFRPVWPLPASPVKWPDGLILNDNGIATLWPPRTFTVRAG